MAGGCRDPRNQQVARTKAKARARQARASGRGLGPRLGRGLNCPALAPRSRTAGGGTMARPRVRLVVTADDFGYCPRRDEGIVEAFLAGAVTSVSLLVNGAAAESAAELARR